MNSRLLWKITENLKPSIQGKIINGLDQAKLKKFIMKEFFPEKISLSKEMKWFKNLDLLIYAFTETLWSKLRVWGQPDYQIEKETVQKDNKKRLQRGAKLDLSGTNREKQTFGLKAELLTTCNTFWLELSIGFHAHGKFI